MVGDRWRDVEAGRRAGCRTVFIDRGYRERRPDPPADHDAADLSEAADWILSDREKGPISASSRGRESGDIHRLADRTDRSDTARAIPTSQGSRPGCPASHLKGSNKDDHGLSCLLRLGPGDIIEAHKEWRQGRSSATEISLTFSPQYEVFCRRSAPKPTWSRTIGGRRSSTTGCSRWNIAPSRCRVPPGCDTTWPSSSTGSASGRRPCDFRSTVAVVESGSTYFFVLTCSGSTGSE